MIWIIALIIVIALMVIKKKINEKKEREEVEAWKYQKKIEQREKEEYGKLESEVVRVLGDRNWDAIANQDEKVIVKSRQALEKYDEVKFFKENKGKLARVEAIINQRNTRAAKLQKFLEDNEYKSWPQYFKMQNHITMVIKKLNAYRISVRYISSAGNNLGERYIVINQECIDRFKNDPSLLMGKTEYNKLLKEQQKAALEKKQQEYYKSVNDVIECANNNRDALVVKGARERLDDLVGQLFDRTVNSIKKIKTPDSEEWDVIDNAVTPLRNEIEQLVSTNQQILAYYDSPDFAKIKETCEVLMSTQREFNEYINEKVQSISQLFGTRVVRTETTHEDEYNYIRPYKKTITPFTAEVSATVFASAENNPLEYIVKYFYPHKSSYPEQIQKLYQLVEELETLRDAKQIIENYKAEYQQYLGVSF